MALHHRQSLLPPATTPNFACNSTRRGCVTDGHAPVGQSTKEDKGDTTSDASCIVQLPAYHRQINRTPLKCCFRSRASGLIIAQTQTRNRSENSCVYCFSRPCKNRVEIASLQDTLANHAEEESTEPT